MDLATVERAPRALSPITERSLQSPPESAPSTLRSHPDPELLLNSPPPPVPVSPNSTFPGSPSSSNFATAPSSPSITSIPSPIRRDRRRTSSRARASSIQRERGPESPTRLDPLLPLSPTISGGGGASSSTASTAPPLPQTQARRDITPSRLPRPTPALPQRHSSLKGQPRVTPHGHGHGRRSDGHASRASPPPLPPVPPVPPLPPLPPSLASTTSLASCATSTTAEPSPTVAPSTSGSTEPHPRQLARTSSYYKRKPVPSLEDLRVLATRAAARDASPSRASMSTGSSERLVGSVGGTSFSEEPSTGQASSEPVTGVPMSDEGKQISPQHRSNFPPNGTAIRARPALAVRHWSMDASLISAPRSNPSLKVEGMSRPSSTPPSPRKGTPKALVPSQPPLLRSGSSRPFSLPAFGLVRGQSAFEPGKRGSMDVPRAVSVDHRPHPSSAAEKRRPTRMLSPSPTKPLQSTPEKLLDPDESSSLFKRRSGRLSSLFSRSKSGKTPTTSPRNSVSGLDTESLAGDTPIRTAIRTSGTFGVRDDGSDNACHGDVRPYGSYDFAHYHPRCTSAGSLVDAHVRRKLYAQNADAPSEDDTSTLGQSAGGVLAHDKTQKLSPLPEFGENATLTTSPESPPSLSRSSSDHTLPSAESMHRHLLQLSPCSTSVPSSMHNSVHNSAHNSARNSEQHLGQGHPSSEVLLLVASHMLSTHAATLLRHAETMNEVSTTMRTMAAESLEWGSRLMGLAGVASIHSTPAASSTPQMPSIAAFDLKGFPTPPNTTPSAAQTRPAVTRDVPVTLREDSPTRSARPEPLDALLDDDPLTPVRPRPTRTRKASGTAARGKGPATGMSTIPGNHAPHTAAHTSNSDHGAAHNPPHDPNLLSPPSHSVPHRPQSPAAAYLLDEAGRLGRDGWANLGRAEDVWTHAMTDLRDMARDIANGAHMVAREAQSAADASAAEAASVADASIGHATADDTARNGNGLLWHEALLESEGGRCRKPRESAHLADDHTPTVRPARRPLPTPPVQANGSAAGRTTPTTAPRPDSYSSQSTPTQARPRGPRSSVPAPIPVPSVATSVASPLNSPVTSLRPPPRLRGPSSRTLPSSQSMPVGLEADEVPRTLLSPSISSHELGSTSDARSTHSGRSAHKANNMPNRAVVRNGSIRPRSPNKPNGPLGLNIANGPPGSTLEVPDSTSPKVSGEQVRQVEPATLAILSRRGTQRSSWLAEAAPNADGKGNVERRDTITSQRPLSSRATSPLPLPPGAMAPRHSARRSLSSRPLSPLKTSTYAHSTSSTVETATSSVHSLPHTNSVASHSVYGHTPYIYTHNSSHTPGPGRESPAPHFHPPPPPSASSTSVRAPSVSTPSLKTSLKFLDPRHPPPIPSTAIRGIQGVPTSTSMSTLHVPKTGGQGGTAATSRPSLTLPRPNHNPNRRSDSHIRTAPTQPALSSFPRSVSTTTLTSRSRSASGPDLARRPSLSLYRRLRARRASPSGSDFSPAPNGRRESGEPESAHSLRRRWLGLRWGK